MIQRSHIVAIAAVLALGGAAGAVALQHRSAANAAVASNDFGNTSSPASWNKQAVDAAPMITHLEVHPVDRLSPGSDLSFNLHGSPGAKASIHMAGRPTLPMTEVSPGAYHAVYTVGQNDNLDPDARVLGELSRGGNTNTMALSMPLTRGAASRGRVMATAEPDRQVTPTGGKAVIACASCGTVLRVQRVDLSTPTTGIGGVTGGILGAVVGSQFGGGSGKTLAGVAGAVGGAYAGNAIEKNRNRHSRYDVVVQLQGGRQETVSYDHSPAWRAGDAVRLEAGALRSQGA